MITAVAIMPLADAAHQLVNTVFPLAFAPVFRTIEVIRRASIQPARRGFGSALIGVSLPRQQVKPRCVAPRVV